MSVLSNLHPIADLRTDNVAFQFEDMITDMERKLLGKQKQKQGEYQKRVNGKIGAGNTEHGPFFTNEITIADETSRFIDSSNEIRSSLSKDDRSIEIGDEDEDVDEEYYGRVVVLSLT